MSLNGIKGPNERWILSCDGGGIRGIVTLRCLEALEAFAGAPCRALFDMFAGTSTGAIIAGALASGRLGVPELIALYRDRRTEIFAPRFGSFLHPLVTKYHKAPLHRLLREQLGDLTLEQCGRDLMITATDTVRSETIYFSAFHPPTGPPFGLYRNLPIRHVIEASASAPTYFVPHGRFIDGGIGVHNNPCYAAAVEALRYSSDRRAGQPWTYDHQRVMVFSFGTGMQANAMEPGEALRKWGVGWIQWVIGEGMDQANVQQSYVCFNELDAVAQAVRFYRYDLYLTPPVLVQAGVAADFDPGRLTLDAVDDEAFKVLDEVGRFYADHLRVSGFFLQSPEPPAAGHWDEFVLPPLPADYLQQISDDFVEMDERLA